MDMLIKHGTWMIVPGGLVLALVYNYVYARVFPRLLARSLDEEDRRAETRPMRIRIVLPRKSAPAGRVTEPVKAS